MADTDTLPTLTDEQKQALALIPSVNGASYAAPRPSGIPSVGQAPQVAAPAPTAPPIPSANAVPSLAPPTKQQSQTAGKAEYASGLPTVTAAPLTPEYYQQQRALSDFKAAHPLGSDISAKPGFLGKVEHGLATAGNIAGNALIPGAMAGIPGTSLNNAIQRGGQERGFTAAVGNEEKEAATEKTKAETENPAQQKLAQNDVELFQRDPQAFKQYRDMVSAQKEIGDPVKTIIEDKDGNEIAIMESGKKMPLGVQGQTKTSEDKTPAHITVMKNGKPHIMERDPQSGEYSVDRGEAPPSYAMVAPSLKTIDVIDPNTGLPTVETMGGKQLGTAATGAYGHEMAQAGAVQRGGEQLISDLQANRARLGSLSTWVEKYGLNTPIADPQLAGLQAELSTFAALQPAMHGFRSHSALETFNQIIGGLQKNPDATIASIRGILRTAQNINPALGGSNAPAVGTEEGGYRFKGGDPSKKENWEKK